MNWIVNDFAHFLRYMSENNNRRQKQKIIAFKESLEVVNRQKNTATQKNMR